MSFFGNQYARKFLFFVFLERSCRNTSSVPVHHSRSKVVDEFSSMTSEIAKLRLQQYGASTSRENPSVLASNPTRPAFRERSASGINQLLGTKPSPAQSFSHQSGENRVPLQCDQDDSTACHSKALSPEILSVITHPQESMEAVIQQLRQELTVARQEQDYYRSRLVTQLRKYQGLEMDMLQLRHQELKQKERALEAVDKEIEQETEKKKQLLGLVAERVAFNTELSSALERFKGECPSLRLECREDRSIIATPRPGLVGVSPPLPIPSSGAAVYLPSAYLSRRATEAMEVTEQRARAKVLEEAEESFLNSFSDWCSVLGSCIAQEEAAQWATLRLRQEQELIMVRRCSQGRLAVVDTERFFRQQVESEEMHQREGLSRATLDGQQELAMKSVYQWGLQRTQTITLLLTETQSRWGLNLLEFDSCHSLHRQHIEDKFAIERIALSVAYWHWYSTVTLVVGETRCRGTLLQEYLADLKGLGDVFFSLQQKYLLDEEQQDRWRSERESIVGGEAIPREVIDQAEVEELADLRARRAASFQRVQNMLYSKPWSGWTFEVWM
jgi:hypothetical protein